jgi:hypothetical protein
MKIEDGKYEDVSSTTRSEIKERRAQVLWLSACICALFSVAFLLISMFDHDRRELSGVVAFALAAVIQFRVSKVLAR